MASAAPALLIRERKPQPMSETRPCKDCLAHWWVQGVEFRTANKFPARPAPHPGPRCATHHRAAVKARKAKAHANYVGKTYGLAEGEYQKLYEHQGGVCAICRRATGATRKLSVDHDHKCCPGGVSCGRCVRGLLCRPCNDMLGHLRDDSAAVARAHMYLWNPPAKRILNKGASDA